MVKPSCCVFFSCTEYIVFKTVSIHQFLGCCSVNCHLKIDYLVTDQVINTIYNVESTDSQYIKHLIKAIEYRSKEDCQAASGVPIPDHVICSMPTEKYITLDHNIVKNRLVCGYSGYQNLVGAFDTTTVGGYSKAIILKGEEKTTTEVNTVKIPSAKNIRRDSTYFSKFPRPFQPSCHRKPQQVDTPR